MLMAGRWTSVWAFVATKRKREEKKTQDISGWNFSFIPNSIAQTFEKMLLLGLIFTKFILRL